MIDFITVAKFSFPYEFIILKHLLEQEGIRFFFQNETVFSFVLSSNALGSINLKVHRDDIIQTKEIIERLQNETKLRVV